MTIFIDTAVIMYAAGREHPLREPCRTILRHAESGRLLAVTSAEVIQEIFHRFTVVDSRERGARMAEGALDLFAPVLPITHAVMQRMGGLVTRYPHLTARDLVHVATCAEEGITAIVTPDEGFRSVVELRRVRPDDEIALRPYLR
ncbi:MAG: type II toxin-antitoxin system VapC family toxin [Egibacteraceae bacterium]